MTESIQFKCGCGQRLRAPQRLAGHSINCPKCQAQVVVPFDSTEPAFTETIVRQEKRPSTTAKHSPEETYQTANADTQPEATFPSESPNERDSLYPALKEYQRNLRRLGTFSFLLLTIVAITFGAISVWGWSVKEIEAGTLILSWLGSIALIGVGMSIRMFYYMLSELILLARNVSLDLREVRETTRRM